MKKESNENVKIEQDLEQLPQEPSERLNRRAFIGFTAGALLLPAIGNIQLKDFPVSSAEALAAGKEPHHYEHAIQRMFPECNDNPVQCDKCIPNIQTTIDGMGVTVISDALGAIGDDPLTQTMFDEHHTTCYEDLQDPDAPCKDDGIAEKLKAKYTAIKYLTCLAGLEYDPQSDAENKLFHALADAFFGD